MGIPYTETDLPIMLSKIAFFTTFFGSAIVSLLYSGMVPVVSAMEKNSVFTGPGHTAVTQIPFWPFCIQGPAVA